MGSVGFFLAFSRAKNIENKFNYPLAGSYRKHYYSEHQ